LKECDIESSHKPMDAIVAFIAQLAGIEQSQNDCGNFPKCDKKIKFPIVFALNHSGYLLFSHPQLSRFLFQK
jgi:hypothetical protein